jgi:hypothetical protein
MNAINTTELKDLIAELEFAIPQLEKTDQSISNSNVGWHIAHSLLVFNGIIETISRSDPKEYKWSFNLKRLVVFAKKKIPRGVAKAPRSVVPIGDHTMVELKDQIEKAKMKLGQLKELNSKQFFNHPTFGNIRLKQTIRFLVIHTKHHLDIIQDIIQSEQ